MKAILVALVIGAVMPGTVLGADPARSPMVAQAKTDSGAMPKVGEARVVSVRGTVEAIDKEKQTVTLKGPKRSLTLRVRDPKKLDAIKVGDPVVGKYYESLMIEVKKPGESTPGVTAEKAVGTSKPGETPAGASGRQGTRTAPILSAH